MYEEDGTALFTDALKKHLEQRFICSVWYDKSDMYVHSEFLEEMKKGLLEASSVIVCLTPLYLTRPNCLRELKWALDLRDFLKDQRNHPFKVFVLALHPSVTYAGRQNIKATQCVILPKYKEYGTPSSEEHVVVHRLSEPALKLLDRLDQFSSYAEFIDAMPWRSNFEDWSKDVPEIDLSYSDKVPQNAAEFLKPSEKTVHGLMDDFCKEFSKELRNPPMASPGYEFVDIKSDVDLHSTPQTLKLSDQDAPLQLDSIFFKFLHREESQFSKTIFSHKHAYLLTLMGLSCEQLINLTDNPIGFRDPGPGNRSVNIDKWLRKGALLVLSRTFSSTLLEKKAISHRKDPAHTLLFSTSTHPKTRKISDPAPKSFDKSGDSSDSWSAHGARSGVGENSTYGKESGNMMLFVSKLQQGLSGIQEAMGEIVKEKKEVSVLFMCSFCSLACSAPLSPLHPLGCRNRRRPRHATRLLSCRK